MPGELDIDCRGKLVVIFVLESAIILGFVGVSYE